MIAAGGTGGHVYPALAAAEAVLAQAPAAELYFVESVGDFARPLVDEAGVHFAAQDAVRAGPLHGVSPLQMLKSIVAMAVGTIQAFRLIGRHRPAALLLTGGWVGLPVALAARLRGVPALIYLPDIEPGLAIKRLEPLARAVAVTVADSAQFFPRKDKIRVTGYPIRASMRAATREQAIQHFGLDPNKRTLLVFGGSRGARTINTAVIAAADALLAAGLQILHVTGTLDWDDNSTRIQGLGSGDYHAFPYLHADMGLAMAAADLVVCRAGASTLGELPYFGLPSILVPYPFAWRYQKVNADWLAERGAAIVMRDEDMAAQLSETIVRLINDASQLNSMRKAALTLAQPDGARSSDGAANLAHELLTLAEAGR
jgi:UDP-N-acetylglucosamine--N-acetylmuramyl-(pentapeptide) pyrophosphoryl-undecaprenol N-acetylglucosamine transferase